MILNWILAPIFLIAAVSPNPEDPQTAFNQKYKSAIDEIRKEGSCKELELLSKNDDFRLHELAGLRWTEKCVSNPNWENLEENTKMSLLLPFISEAHFRWAFENKKYKEAYQVYRRRQKAIDLDGKEFDDLATNTLKTNLSKKEKEILSKKLEERSPRFIKNPKKKEYQKVARDFRRDRQFEKALFYYRKVINDPSFSLKERWYAFKGARLTYKLERWSRMKKYIKASKQWADFLQEEYKRSRQLTRYHHNANIEYVRTLWTEKGQSLAGKVLDQLEKDLKGRYSLQMVYWLKGKMAEERKEYKKAVFWLDKSSNERKVSDSDLQRVLWALAWNQRRINDFAGSQATLERLKKSPDLTHFAKTKYLYWQAENILSQGKKEEGMEAFRRLAEFDLYGFYGALAYRKLGESFPSPPRPTLSPNNFNSFFKPTDFALFESLVEVDERELAEALINDEVKQDPSWGTEEWVAYLKLLQKAGAYRRFFIRYHSLPPKLQLSVLEEHPYLLFPQPYKKEVVQSSKKTQVSPALIYSIMKQESGFDVKARSPADAFGLLQLIPQVAEKAAERMPTVAYSDPYDLFKPHVVIPLGANNLHHLFSRFNGNFILSVASYNASEQAVKGWIKSRFHGDPITFIEDIPYEETKGYVKLVMRNYITYNRFQEKEEPFTFPEICLSGLEKFK